MINLQYDHNDTKNELRYSKSNLVRVYIDCDCDSSYIILTHIGQVGRMEVGCGMHSFIEIFFLNVGVTIDMDDANVFRRDRCQTSDGGESNGMITSKNDGHGTMGGNVSNSVGDLVKALFDIGGDSEDIANITESLKRSGSNIC